MPGFRELLGKIAQAYRDRRQDIEAQNASLIKAFESTTPGEPPVGALDREPTDAVVPELAQVFDAVNGGIGSAPKFPHPYELSFCIRRNVLDGDATAGAIDSLTLTKMAEGGIYDHLACGFCRYSTDEHCTIPHFEKMLYDNGPLLALYADAWCVTRDAL